MAKVRCKRTDEDSFFGNFLYERVIPKDHFMVKLKELVDWPRYTKQLIKYYKGKGELGQAPYDPALILKMLLILSVQYLREADRGGSQREFASEVLCWLDYR